MPKSIKEITRFNTGTILNVSEKDIPIESPVYSLNINPMAEGGILDSIYNNKLIASINEDKIVRFENPVSWGDNGTISSTLKSYNASNVVLTNIKGFDNKALSYIDVVGTKGRKEKLKVNSIEPWWELLETNESVKSYPILKASANLNSNETELDYSGYGKASATISVSDGDDGHGTTKGEYIRLINTDGLTVDYVISQTDGPGAATGTAIVSATTNIGGGTTYTIPDGVDKAVAVGLNFSSAVKRDILEQLKDAIGNANGHEVDSADTITSTSPGTAANGIQYIKLQQSVGGESGNTQIAKDISSITVSDYSGTNDTFSEGSTFHADFNEGDYLSLVGIEDSGINVNEANGLAATSSSQAVTVDGTTATTNTHANRVFVKSDGTLVGTCTAVGSGTSITFGGGLINPLINNDDLYMIKSFDGNVSYETLQVKEIISAENKCIIERSCFGTRANELSVNSYYYVYAQRQTIDSIQRQTNKGTCLLSDWSDYSGNHLKANGFLYRRDTSSAAVNAVNGIFTCGTGGSEYTITFSNSDKTMTIGNTAYGSTNFKEGDTITLYHSATNSNGNIGNSFKILKYSSGVFTLDKAPVEEVINSGTFIIDSNLVKNGVFYANKTTSSHSVVGSGSTATEYKVNDWEHRGYKAVDSEEDSFFNTYTSKKGSSHGGIQAVSNCVTRTSTGGFWDDTNAGHADISTEYYPFDSGDDYISIESEYWGNNSLEVGTLIPSTSSRGAIEKINIRFNVLGSGNPGNLAMKRLSGNDILKIGSGPEYMKVLENGVNGSTITVERGYLGSTIEEHAVGDDIKKCLNMLISQDISKDKIKPGQTYELMFAAKNNGGTAGSEGCLSISINGGYFDEEGNFKEGSQNLLNGINNNDIPQNEQRWMNFNSISNSPGMADGGQITLDTHWQKFNYTFYIPKGMELSSDLNIEFSSRGPDGSKIGVDLVSLCEGTLGIADNAFGNYISSAGLLQDKSKKDLIMYESGSSALKVIKGFKNANDILTPLNEETFVKSPYLTSESYSSTGNVSMVNNNRELHLGFGPEGVDSSPRWLGYLNRTIFGHDETDTLYYDEDTIHTYDGSQGSEGNAAGSFSKICLAGEYEYIEAEWSSDHLDVTHTAHSMSAGDNIVIREWADASNSWAGRGVWVITSATDNAFECKRLTSLDPNPGDTFLPDTGSTRNSATGRICYRPYHYYAIKEGGYNIYRIFPDTRILTDASGLDTDSNYKKGVIQASFPLNYQIQSITCCYNKATDGTGGGRIYVLPVGQTTPMNMQVLDVCHNQTYDKFNTNPLTVRGNLDVRFRSFKWSNDIASPGSTPTGDILGDSSKPVFGSSASQSTPYIAPSGYASDIVETKGPEPSFVIAAQNRNENQPVDFGCRIWVQFYHGSGGTFTEGDRFLFCGLTNDTNTNGSGNVRCGDRTPATTVLFPSKFRYEAYDTTGPGQDHNVSFTSGPGVRTHNGQEFDDLNPGISDSVVKKYAIFEYSRNTDMTPAIKISALGPINNVPSFGSVGEHEDVTDGPYLCGTSNSNSLSANPYLHFGYNVGWDGSSGEWPEFTISKYGLIPMGDNDKDGVIDGTGLVVPSTTSLPDRCAGNDGIKTGPYGHYHQRVCAHAVGLLGKTSSRWIRHFGRMMRFNRNLPHYKGGRGEHDDFPVAKDAPENMSANKFLWVCSDVHFGDYQPKGRYTIESISEESNYAGVTNNDLAVINLSESTSALQGGDIIWLDIDGTSYSTYRDGRACYIVEQKDSDSFITNMPYLSDNSISGTAYVYPFNIAGEDHQTGWFPDYYKKLTGRMAIATDSDYHMFHYAYDPSSPDNPEVFDNNNQRAGGHYTRKWFTPPVSHGFRRHSNVEVAKKAFSIASPGILFNIERLNYRAGYMMRPFSESSSHNFDELEINSNTHVDIPCSPDTVYHIKKGNNLHCSTNTTAGTHDNNWTSRLFISSPASGENSRMYICDLDNIAPDSSTQISLEAWASDSYNTNTYNEAEDSSYSQSIEQAVLAGTVAGYDAASSDTNTAYGDSFVRIQAPTSVHPYVKIPMTAALGLEKGFYENGSTSSNFYKQENVWAGYCISVVDKTTGATETRYVIASISSGSYHYLYIHYPFKTRPDSSHSKFFVWQHQNVCTASVRLLRQTSNNDTNLPGTEYIINDYDEKGIGNIFPDWGISIESAATYDSGNKTKLTCQYQHFFVVNDKIEIYNSTNNNFEGTHTVLEVPTTDTFIIAKDFTSTFTAKVRPSNSNSSSGNTAVSNPYYLDLASPAFIVNYGGLDLRKTRSYDFTAISEGVADDKIDIDVGANHTIDVGETLTLNANASAHDDDTQDGVYIVTDDTGEGTNTSEIQVSTTVSSDDTGTLYSDQYELLVSSGSGAFKMGEMRAGMNSWDKGNAEGNIIRYDSTENSDRFLLPVEQIVGAGISISASSIESTSGYFQSGTNYEYKLSFIYDGYQEGLLTQSIYNYNGPVDVESTNINISISNFSKRLSHICVYRRDNANNLFKLVKEIPTDTTWSYDVDSQLYLKEITDTGELGATYESRTGLNELLDDITVKYGMSAEIDGYLFVGNCSHNKIKNASNLVFRSKPARFSTFDYVNDTIRLKSPPKAMVNFLGRLYIFDSNNIYKVNQESLVIEDIYEGVGCLSQNSLIVTEYGLFFADSNGAYIHDGNVPNKISNSIFKGGDVSGSVSFDGSDNINNLSWDNVISNSHKRAPMVTFDSNMQSALFLFEYNDVKINSDNEEDNIRSYYIWSYHIPGQRWDLWELDTNVNIGNPFIGELGKVNIPINSGLYELRGGSTKKDYTWISKKINAEFDSVLKVFNKVKINGTSTNFTLNGSNKESSDRLLVNTNVGNLSNSDITHKEDTSNNASYKLSGSNRKGRWLQFKLEDIDEPIDSVGIIYRLRAVK